MELHDAQRIGGGEDSLVGEDGNVALSRDVGESVNVGGSDGLLHQLDIEPLLCHLGEDADGLARTPCLIGVNADAHVFADRVADGDETGDIERGINSYLDLERVVAATDGIACVARHLLGRIDADRDVGHDAVPCSAEQFVYGDVPELPVEIVERHIDSGLCRGIVDKCGLHITDEILELVHVPSDQQRGKVRADRVDDAARCVTRYDARRRCLAIARCTRIGTDENDDILDAVHAAACCFERNTQGNRKHAQFDVRNFHGNPPFVYRILS